jgi:hypothetical protein
MKSTNTNGVSGMAKECIIMALLNSATTWSPWVQATRSLDQEIESRVWLRSKMLISTGQRAELQDFRSKRTNDCSRGTNVAGNECRTIQERTEDHRPSAVRLPTWSRSLMAAKLQPWCGADGDESEPRADCRTNASTENEFGQGQQIWLESLHACSNILNMWFVGATGRLEGNSGLPKPHWSIREERVENGVDHSVVPSTLRVWQGRKVT